MASPPQSDMADDYQFPLPGFRFHPTDEELVVFYLRRKVHNKPLAIELIKQIDIYKYSPWDLPRTYVLTIMTTSVSKLSSSTSDGFLNGWKTQ